MSSLFYYFIKTQQRRFDTGLCPFMRLEWVSRRTAYGFKLFDNDSKITTSMKDLGVIEITLML